MHENDLATRAPDVCFRIHKLYGPGLYESVYEEIFCYEWRKEDIAFTRQQGIPVIHENLKLDIGFRTDIIIAGKLILELKSIEALAEVHYKQVLTYLKLTGCKLGLLINFNVPMLRDGIHCIANKL